MKLSQMSTDKAADVLMDISASVAEIATDDEVIDVIRAFTDKAANAPLIETIGIVAKTALPLALKKHRQDVYAILSALTGKSLDDIKAQNIVFTIRDVKECVDKDLLDFFSPAAATGKKTR